MADMDFTLASGAVLHVSTASFAEANALVKALLRCAKGMPIGDDLLKQDITAFKDVLIEAATSEDAEKALFGCMRRASYKSTKLVPENFDSLGDDFRQDYFEVCWKIIEVNCSPFFAKAFSALKARLTSAAASPKQPSSPTTR